MKFFSAIFCIFAIAANTALASIGGLVYCIDRQIEEHPSHSGTAVGNGEDACCPVELYSSTQELRFSIDCECCIDIKIEPFDFKKANPSVKRIAAKAFPEIDLSSLDLAIFIGEKCVEQKQLTVRAPPIPSGASFEYAATIQFRC